MVLLLDDRDIELLLTPDDFIFSLEQGYRDLGLQKGVNMPRYNLDCAGHEGTFKVLAAHLSSYKAIGVHAYTGGFSRTREVSRKIVALFNTSDGGLSALVNTGYLSWIRTAATSALATRYLANPTSNRLAVIGTGRQAKSHARLLKRVLPLKEIVCYSRKEENRLRFCREVGEELMMPVYPAASAREAVEGAGVVVTATNWPEPVVLGAWLAPGTHVNAIGAHYPDSRELDSEAVVKSKVVVDIREQALGECGEILIPIQEGLVGPEHIHADLGELAAGLKPGRESPGEITVFSSGGTGVDYVAVAALAVERAREKGIGQELDWAGY